MTTGIVRDQNLEKHIHKQMGCMAGFLQIFDRHQILTGKRIYSPKRLPPASPEPDKVTASPARSVQSPAREVVQSEPKASSPALPVLEFKEGTRSSWKFSREAPRLSLDSRAVVDAKGTLHLHTREIPSENDGDKQRRSTSVIAKLMGLEPLPDSEPGPGPIAKLQRSASESRVSRDLSLPLPLPQCRFLDTNNFPSAVQVTNVVLENNNAAIDARLSNGRAADPPRQRVKKSFYDSADFFPEPKHTASVYGEIERRLRMRGINEPSKDLHTLKHILEALQLKGLLHSNGKSNQSPIVVMKPVRSMNRTGNDSPPPLLRSSPRRSPRVGNENRRIDQNERSSMSQSNRALSSSPNRRKQQNVEPQRKVGVDSRRGSVSVSPVHSPKASPRRNAGNQQVPCGSPRVRRNVERKLKMLGGAEDESSTVSENSFSTSSYPDTERYRLEEYKEGKDLLDRCDKLLNSIAEITAANELQPSPVSVLDSSFDKDDWCSPSPITKRCIDYKDQAAESEDDMWSAALCSSEEAASEDCDFVYVSEILRACSYLPEECDIFLLLEKQQCLKGKDTSKASTLQRRLIFDTLQEILERNQQLPPWKAVSYGEQRQKIWSEFRRIREREESESEDLFKVICGVLKKDMAEEMPGWGEWAVEMGDVVLDIERLVFKDLVGETIRELASFSPHCNNDKLPALRRKLLF
ncbi:protein LONGIFOLIA 1 [Vigna radiata var. radiata]|uniref:Protein LONGIFOLIA 1 n=1 Tax=Vigna radiata var. radiata TaxID=3916 RepID=A0A1S3V8V7_VIGRR|nr:protein LONGIFOLIA 1 [Vigna radiata var. radiata]